MKRVESDALDIVARAFGLTGEGTPGPTEFLDKELVQVVDVVPAIRRGRTQAGTAGTYWGVLRNIHGAADTQTSVIIPYDIATGAIAPFPAPMPRGFDIWLLAAAVDQLSGTGTFTGALFISTVGSQGFGIDSASAAVVVTTPLVLAHWDSVITQTHTFGLQESGNPWVRLGMRLPRNDASDAALTFSSTSSAIATFDLYLLIGVFPTALGQDMLG